LRAHLIVNFFACIVTLLVLVVKAGMTVLFIKANEVSESEGTKKVE